jgi:hypothetical protein
VPKLWFLLVAARKGDHDVRQVSRFRWDFEATVFMATEEFAIPRLLNGASLFKGPSVV